MPPGLVPCAALLAAALLSCDRGPSLGPPTIAYGQDVCAVCGMIVTDDRFACGAIAAAPRGARPRTHLFDDLGCLLEFEEGRRGEEILARWVRDSGGTGWLEARSAAYVQAAGLHTPMASGLAACATEQAAEALAAAHAGTVLTFDTLREGSPRSEGSVTAPAHGARP